MVQRREFAEVFEIGRLELPRNLALLGFSPSHGWLVCGEAAALPQERIAPLRRFWLSELAPRLPELRFWLFCCLADGWRERVAPAEDYALVTAAGAGAMDEWRGPPGAIPALAGELPVVGCFAAHRGDPSALLLPEPHFLRDGYRRLRARVALARRPWAAKRDRGVYGGGDHGEVLNQLGPAVPGRPHARRRLREVVSAEGLDVDVFLGASVGRARQIGYRYVLDVDGFVRTWDAWAWKLLSGSVVFSQESAWETFFTRQFAAWEHFVPVANDFADLGEKLAWCRRHDDACRAIGRRARERARHVYAPAAVRELAAATIRERLLGAAAAGP